MVGKSSYSKYMDLLVASENRWDQLTTEWNKHAGLYSFNGREANVAIISNVFYMANNSDISAFDVGRVETCAFLRGPLNTFHGSRTSIFTMKKALTKSWENKSLLNGKSLWSAYVLFLF